MTTLEIQGIRRNWRPIALPGAEQWVSRNVDLIAAADCSDECFRGAAPTHIYKCNAAAHTPPPQRSTIGRPRRRSVGFFLRLYRRLYECYLRAPESLSRLFLDAIRCSIRPDIGKGCVLLCACDRIRCSLLFVINVCHIWEIFILYFAHQCNIIYKLILYSYYILLFNVIFYTNSELWTTVSCYVII